MASFKKFAKKYLKRKMAKKQRRRPRRIASAIHSFKRTVYQPGWINTLSVGDTTFTLNPQLSDLPGYKEFTNLFDQYRFTGVSVKLIPRFNVVNGTPTGTIPLPPTQIMTALDYDGGWAADMLSILQYQTLKTTRGTAIHQRFFKPAMLSMAYETALSTAYVPKWNQFIDTNDEAVPHYGLIGLIPNIGVTYSYDLQCTYYVQFKNVK